MTFNISCEMRKLHALESEIKLPLIIRVRN